jgi:hypothetical protein
MTPSFAFERDGWIEGELDDPNEEATFTRLRIRIESTVVTRNFSKRGGGESEGINVPLVPLASYISKYWWRLLYEPLRSVGDNAFQACHRLDTPMHGYVFPALAMCSADDEAILADWTIIDNEYAPIKFLTSQPAEPVQLTRESVEAALSDLVEAVIDRVGPASTIASQLRQDWERVRASMSSADELAYCKAAGRLGLDPYDPSAPDLEDSAADVPPSLFNDITDAVDVAQLKEATSWTKKASVRLSKCPKVDIDAFGNLPLDNIKLPAWNVGASAARQLRRTLGLQHLQPKTVVNQLLGRAVRTGSAIATHSPESSLTALTRRVNGSAYIGAVAQSARQQRFRACVAAYLAWSADAEEERAGTTAFTRRQQASRAFAAELVAPQEFLKERAGEYGFTSDNIEDMAGNLIAPYETVLWQSFRAGIRLRGVDLPINRQPRLL